MKQIIKKLFSSISFLINWQHSFFYLFLVFVLIYFLISNYTVSSDLNYGNVFYSLGRSILLSLVVAFTSMLIGLIFILTSLARSMKVIKIILDNIFIFPEIIYIFILLFGLSPVSIYELILSLSIIRAYTFYNILMYEIIEIKNKEFINALRAVGLKRLEIIRKHILPIMSIPIAIFLLETLIWFIVVEFIISFINIVKIYPSIGLMINHFTINKDYKSLYVLLVTTYLFIFELSYIINNIKLKFEILFKKES